MKQIEATWKSISIGLLLAITFGLIMNIGIARWFHSYIVREIHEHGGMVFYTPEPRQ